MKTLGERIKERRKDLNLSQAELAEKLGYADRSTIAKIEKGVNDIAQSRIAAFAKGLHTTPAYLMGWTDDWYDYDADEDNRFSDIPIAQFNALQDHFRGDLPAVWHAWLDIQDENVQAATQISSTPPRNIIPMPKMKRIPLIGAITCGTPILAAENFDGEVDIPAEIHADFALRCKGDSMINARIYDGDIVYIRQQEEVEHGEIAAVLIDDAATLKRVYLYDDHISMEAENPQYRPIVYWGDDMNNVKVIGKAVAFTSTVK